MHRPHDASPEPAHRWALTQLFDERGFRRVIVLEDDMELSPDFFHFFGAMAPRLDTDPSLWCVSSWNDNGQTEFVSNATAVYRSDFFPGLGWMLAKHVWDELRPIWTTGPASIPGVFGGYWDDWYAVSPPCADV
jgi:alpha-1,3-mannosyl-glycoprotein beta-1,2-N-acetylglucosaminyltransferase